MANANPKKANPAARPLNPKKPAAGPAPATAVGGIQKLFILVAGAVLGALVGLWIGSNLVLEWHGTPLDLRAVAVVAGTVIGFWVALLSVRKR